MRPARKSNGCAGASHVAGNAVAVPSGCRIGGRRVRRVSRRVDPRHHGAGIRSTRHMVTGERSVNRR
jgi:hypothetical protein